MDALARIEDAREAVREAEDALARAREDYRRAVTAAVDSGVSMAAIGRALGVTRQRVARIIRGE